MGTHKINNLGHSHFTDYDSTFKYVKHYYHKGATLIIWQILRIAIADASNAAIAKYTIDLMDDLKK